MIVGAFGLRKDPFRITPDPQFFFVGAAMRPALEELAAALLGRRGLLLVLGDTGTGKTTLLRKMEADLEAGGSIALIVTQPRTGVDDILNRWAEKLGIQVEPGDRDRIVAAIRACQRAAGRDALAVILVDEADHCSAALLRDLVALGEPSHDGGDGFQTVLAGQKVLEARLTLEAPDVRQRVAGVTHLECLSPAEVDAYLRHRLEIAGYAGPDLFASNLVARIAELTEGVPRLINHLCGRALALANEAGESVVSSRTLEDAARDCMLLDFEVPTVKPVIAQRMGAPPGPVLAEKFVAQRPLAAAPAPADGLDIPKPKPTEASGAAQAKGDATIAKPHARPERAAAESAGAAHGAVASRAAEAISVDIPAPPVSKRPTKRAMPSHGVDRTPPEAVETKPDEETSSTFPVVTLVAAPAEPAEMSAVVPDEAIPAAETETPAPPASSGETETVLELPLTTLVSDFTAHPPKAAPTDTRALITSADADIEASGEAPAEESAKAAVEPATKSVDESTAETYLRPRQEAPVEPSAAEPSPHDKPSYVPISRAAVSKLVGRHRVRAVSEANAAASHASRPPAPPPSLPEHQMRASTRAIAESPTTEIPSGLEMRRRRSVLETSEAASEPERARSSVWLRHAAMIGVLIAGAAAAAYLYLRPAGAPESPPPTVAAPPLPTAAIPSVPVSPVQSRVESAPLDRGTDKDAQVAADSPSADLADEPSLERPALPVPKVLRLPSIDPRQQSGTGATSPPSEVAPAVRSPSGSSLIDTPNVTVAAVDASQSGIAVDAGESMVARDDAAPPTLPLRPTPPASDSQGEQSPVAEKTSPGASDGKAPQAAAPVGPRAPAIFSESAPETPTPISARELAPPAAPSAPDSLRSRLAEEEGPERSEPPAATNVAAVSPPVEPAPEITESLPAPSPIPAPAALTESPPPTSSEPSTPAAAPSAATRTAEPTRAASVAVALGPTAAGIRLTQGGGGIGAEQLIARGDIYLRDGDIASARLLYEAAVRLGNAAAARRVGMTYDPIEHRRLRIVGVSPNAHRALDWYRQAMEAGDAEAQRRHADLSAWMARSGAR